jgi:hypothetical protein
MDGLFGVLITEVLNDGQLVISPYKLIDIKLKSIYRKSGGSVQSWYLKIFPPFNLSHMICF